MKNQDNDVVAPWKIDQVKGWTSARVCTWCVVTITPGGQLLACLHGSMGEWQHGIIGAMGDYEQGDHRMMTSPMR